MNWRGYTAGVSRAQASKRALRTGRRHGDRPLCPPGDRVASVLGSVWRLGTEWSVPISSRVLSASALLILVVFGLLADEAVNSIGMPLVQIGPGTFEMG